jgi:hypothetical protein
MSTTIPDADAIAAEIGVKRIPLHTEDGLNCGHEPKLPRIVIDNVPYEGLRESQVRAVWPDRADEILAQAND